MKKLLFILLGCSLILGGCANYRNIELTDVEVVSFSMVSFNAAQAEVKLEVDNPTRATFEIVGVDGSIKKQGNVFASILQVDTPQKCRIAPGASSVANITLRGELSDPIAVFAGGLKQEHFTADVTIRIKQGIITKRIVLKDVPVGELVKEIIRK